MNSSKHFTAKELSCKGGCDTGKMDEEFLAVLERIREEFNKPIKLTSAYRCPMYNKVISNSGEDGPHTTGKAVDIACSGKDAHEILTLALEEGITGIGISQKGAHHKRFIHIDTLGEGTLRPWVWNY